MMANGLGMKHKVNSVIYSEALVVRLGELCPAFLISVFIMNHVSGELHTCHPVYNVI